MTKLWVAKGKGQPQFIESNETEFVVLRYDGMTNHRRELANMTEYMRDGYGCSDPEETQMRSGDYYPRIWRGDHSPSPDKLGNVLRAQWVSTVRSTRMLYSRLPGLFAAVEPNKVQEETFGLLQREILILACTEVESAWRSVLAHNNAKPRSGKADRWSTADYVRLEDVMRLSGWLLTLSSHHGYRTINPFGGWNPANPTTSLPWYDAYNAVKHGREDNLERATFKNAVDAVAAAFIMTVAQFGMAHLAVTDSDKREVHFHADEFTVWNEPIWMAGELYIPPTKSGLSGDWVGNNRWKPVPCPELNDP